VRVASPSALEALLAQIRATAGLSTRTTVVLSTPYENRPVTPPHADGGENDAESVNGDD
jgi:Lrp/AsnC family leucine-responsive transcriptional regulator